MAGPLEGVRVIDTTRFPTGAYVTQMLAGLGAEVWRIDAPGWDPRMMTIGSGLSRAKHSVTVDLRNPAGHDVLRRLASAADVLVENERPGAMDKRGFGPSHAAVELPRLIWCSITGWGQDGPYAQWSGHDVTYTAASGLLTSLVSDLPWYPNAVLSVPIGAVMAATGIITALFERERTGKGTQLDISLAEAATWLLSGSDDAINGTPWSIPYGPDRGLYECADGHFVSTAASEPKSWGALCGALGLEDLAAERPGGSDPAAAMKRLAEVFRTKPARQWVDELGAVGAAVAPVNTGADLLTDPHVAARGGLVEVDGVRVPATPIRFRDAGEPRVTEPSAGAPELGAHTQAALEAAGYTTEEIDALRAAGAIA